MTQKQAVADLTLDRHIQQEIVQKLSKGLPAGRYSQPPPVLTAAMEVWILERTRSTPARWEHPVEVALAAALVRRYSPWQLTGHSQNACNAAVPASGAR